jgi:hypothetical protein
MLLQLFFGRHNVFTCCVYTLCLQWKYYHERDFQALTKKQQQIRRQYIDTQGIMLVWQYYITINTFRVPKQELKDRGQKLPHKTHSDLGYMCKKIHPAENCNVLLNL